jgi:hypothetical protein
MGGNVFPGMNRRYDADEYHALVRELNPIFELLFSKFNVCPAMANKESFGDMDVVVVPKTTLDKGVLCEMFETDLCERNGDSWSLIYRDFQIDLIISNEAEYEFCKNYMGMGDRGNFVGKLAHQLGLKFGHDGLWLPIRTSDSHKLGDVLLTLDPIVAETFLDVRPMSSANCIEEVFENIAASKFFNPEIFFLENNNAIARVRDKKRPNYNLFLEWCTKLPPKEYFPRNKDKSIHLPMIYEAFPTCKPIVEDMLERKRLLDIYKTKLNGNLVSEWTGLEGEALGKFMVTLKNFVSVEKIVETDIEVIEEMVIGYYMFLYKTNSVL